MVETTKKAMDKAEVKNNPVIVRKFGDDKSSLLDHFERLSVEVQLNQATLRRSLSEPAHNIRSPQQPLLISQGPSQPPPSPAQPPSVTKKRRGSGFNKVLKKMIKPILSSMSAKKKEVPDAKDLRFWKAFSRSVRL